MMLPLTASAAVVVNATVTGTRALAATRSPVAMVNTTPVGCVDIVPDGAPAEAIVSASVDTVMPVGMPAVAAPIVKPLRVMVKAVAAGMPATLVEMTICVAVGADENAVINATEAVPAPLFAGVAVVAKNPGG